MCDPRWHSFSAALCTNKCNQGLSNIGNCLRMYLVAGPSLFEGLRKSEDIFVSEA